MTQFRITYDGPALEQHEMEARELAPALLAMANLLESGVKALYGSQANARISVKGTFKKGSFSIDFGTTINVVNTIKDLFAGEGMTALANAKAVLELLGLAGGGAFGLVQLLKWLKNRKITRIEPSSAGYITLVVENDRRDIEAGLLVLLNDREVRESLDQVLLPLDRDGIELFASGSDTEIFTTIDASERHFFSLPAQEDILILEDIRRMAYSIVSLAFKEDNKWRLSDGNSTINAKISDLDFVSRVNASEIAFSKGDVLVCEVKITQWQTETGAKTDYEVIRVLEHWPGMRQVALR